MEERKLQNEVFQGVKLSNTKNPLLERALYFLCFVSDPDWTLFKPIFGRFEIDRRTKYLIF